MLLEFIKTNLVPVFCPSKKDENEKSLFRHVFDSIVNFGKEEEKENKAKDEIIQNKKLVDNFRNLLKKFERMIRIFEMTYLDLKQELQDTIQEMNLQVEPMEVKQSVQVNEIGQVICDEKQMFENGSEPRLIDKKSKVSRRYDSGSREPERAS